MATAYVKSIFAWMIIMWAIVHVTKEKIIENGWVEKWVKDNPDRKPADFTYFFAICAVPILRAILAIGFVYFSITKPEK